MCFVFDGILNASKTNAVTETTRGLRKKSGRKRNKYREKLISAIVIFILAETAIALLWRFSAYYPARMATEDNTYFVRVLDPKVEVVSRRGRKGNSYIRIGDSENEYRIYSGITPRIGGSGKEFVRILSSEPSLELRVSIGGNSMSVCAVSGVETEYFGLDEYNECQKQQSKIGTVILSIFALIGGAAFFAHCRELKRRYHSKS